MQHSFRLVWLMAVAVAATSLHADGLRVGTAAVELEADDSMVIAGGIGPGKAKGQEGQLRVVAVVLEQASVQLAVVACDILMMTRQHLDPVVAEMTRLLREKVRQALNQASERPVNRLASLKRPFTFRVRQFNETEEETAVAIYCRKWAAPHADQIVPVFRDMRKDLAPHQGEQRQTWVQTLLIGDVAIVGVPGEFFAKLGLDIKNRSPYRNTYVAELANDWIGYLPNLDSHKLGGYQVWTGYHSYAEPGTGERMVDQAVSMLRELTGQKPL